MSEQPLVSIIIPTFNRAGLIEETLLSVSNQSYTDWECLIIDDGSEDQTAHLIKPLITSDSRFKYFLRPDELPKGANACRNYGLDQSEGEFINWFDDDDIMHPEKLRIQVTALLETNFPFSVCQTMMFEDNIDNSLGLRKPKIFVTDFFNAFITNEIKWLTQAPLIRRSFLEKSGLRFDESLMQSQERDFFIRLLAQVEAYHYVDEPLVYFRVHDQSISHGKASQEKLRSSFKANYKALVLHNEQLNTEATTYLKDLLKEYARQASEYGFRELFRNMISDLAEIKAFSGSQLQRFKWGYLSYRLFGKGHSFFS